MRKAFGNRSREAESNRPAGTYRGKASKMRSSVKWEALGTIAELVGAVGVIVSLVYVGLEIRQNTRQVEEATRVQRLAQLDAAFETFSRQRLLVAGDSEVARIWLSGVDDPNGLSPVERFRFESMLGDFLNASQVLYARVDEGELYSEVWKDLLVSLEPLLQRPGVAAFWKESKREFRTAFVAAVDSSLDGTQTRPAGGRDSTR